MIASSSALPGNVYFVSVQPASTPNAPLNAIVNTAVTAESAIADCAYGSANVAAASGKPARNAS